MKTKQLVASEEVYDFLKSSGLIMKLKAVTIT